LVGHPAARRALGARAAAQAAAGLDPVRIGRQALEWLSGAT
jgi:hypothetical protein